MHVHVHEGLLPYERVRHDSLTVEVPAISYVNASIGGLLQVTECMSCLGGRAGIHVAVQNCEG